MCDPYAGLEYFRSGASRQVCIALQYIIMGHRLLARRPTQKRERTTAVGGTVHPGFELCRSRGYALSREAIETRCEPMPALCIRGAQQIVDMQWCFDSPSACLMPMGNV